MVAQGVFNETGWVSGTTTTIQWNERVVPPGLSALTYQSDTAPFRTLLTGWYDISLDLEWQAAAGATDDRYVGFSVSNPLVNWDSTTQPFTMSNPRIWSASVGFWPNILIPKLTNISFWGQHTSGSNKDVASAFASITYRGAALGIDPGLSAGDTYTAYNSYVSNWH